MRLSQTRINRLQELLKQLYGLNFTDEQAQQAGLAILRFKLAKQIRAKKLEANVKQRQNNNE